MKYCYLLLIFLFSFSLSQAQSDSDFDVILSKKFYSEADFNYYTGNMNSQEVLQTKSHSFLYKINPVILVLKGAMYAYQNSLSQQLSKQCPYEITCSNFAKASLKEFGLFKGMIISTDRILRCNRLSLLDVFPLDYNPETGKIDDTPIRYQ